MINIKKHIYNRELNIQSIVNQYFQQCTEFNIRTLKKEEVNNYLNFLS